MGRGRPIALLALDGAERETLEQWTRRPKTAQALALRARIVLACADGRSNTGVAAELRVCVDTVGEMAFPISGTTAGRPVGPTAQRSSQDD